MIRVIRCVRKRTSRSTAAIRRASGSSFRTRPITFSPASLTGRPDLPILDVRLAAGLCAFQSHIASRFSGTEGMPEFVILRGLFGGYTVRYSCASCGERLGSPLRDAGNAETCPRCQRALTVPAFVIRQQINAKLKADDDARRERGRAAKRPGCPAKSTTRGHCQRGPGSGRWVV